jgi:Ion channel
VPWQNMQDNHHIPFLIPVAVGIAAVICTFFIHALPLRATINFVRREEKLGRVGVRFWMDTLIVARVMLYALVAHLVEIAFWAVLFVICREFSDFDTAYYHSAVNYTSLGYGDIVMSPAWRLLGPLETADGMLLFGLSTATIFFVIQRLFETRYVDTRK